jgi:hypothetical protein
MEYHIVAFLDVLGFSHMVEEDARVQQAKFLPKFIKIFEQVGNGGKDVRMFSDSIVISKTLNITNFIDMLESCSALQKLFLAEGIMIRGGMSYGKHYSNENMLYSEALVNAYHLESKKARYPRILVDSNLFDVFWNHPDATDVMQNNMRNFLVRDRDGLFFVNYFSASNLTEAKELVTKLLDRGVLKDESVIEKVRWVHDYHCYSVLRFNQLDAAIGSVSAGFSLL